MLLADGKQRVGDGVGEQGRHRQVQPDHAAGRKAEAARVDDGDQDEGAEGQAGEDDLHRGEAAQRDGDP